MRLPQPSRSQRLRHHELCVQFMAARVARQPLARDAQAHPHVAPQLLPAPGAPLQAVQAPWKDDGSAVPRADGARGRRGGHHPPNARAPAAAELLPTRARRFAQIRPCMSPGWASALWTIPHQVIRGSSTDRSAPPSLPRCNCSPPAPPHASTCPRPSPPVGCRPASGTPLPLAAAGSRWAAPPAAAAAAARRRAVTAPQLAAGSGMRSPSCSAPTSTPPLW